MTAVSTQVNKTEVLAGAGSMYVGLASQVVMPLPGELNTSPTISGGWYPAGATSGGLTVTVTQTMFAMRVDQIPDILGHRLTERSITAATSFAQASLRNMAYAVNSSVGVSGTGYSGTLDLVPGQPAIFPLDLAVIIDGYAPGIQKKRRFIGRSVNSVEAVAVAQTKDALTLVPVTFSCLFVDASTSPCTWIDE